VTEQEVAVGQDHVFEHAQAASIALVHGEQSLPIR
jgi:hypothetical protein